MWKLFATQYVNDWDEVCYQPTALGYAALIIVGLLCMGLAVWIVRRSKEGGTHITTRQLMFSAMAMALATVTSMIKLFDAPMGGSVTLFSMLFIVLIGYWYGFGGGLTAALAYGVLQLLIDPYILSFPQMLVDYILAFGALGLAGLFWKNKKKYGIILCYIAGILGRYIFAVISGWIFFGMYASDYGFSSPVVYSLAYNGAYIFLEAGITIVILLIPPVNKALSYVKEIATK